MFFNKFSTLIHIGELSCERGFKIDHLTLNAFKFGAPETCKLSLGYILGTIALVPVTLSIINWRNGKRDRARKATLSGRRLFCLGLCL